MALLNSQALLHCVSKAVLYNIEMTLGKRIKAARERLDPKVTQQAVADHFGVTAQAVSGWERDEALPDIDKIAPISKLLKVPCQWLLEGTGKPPKPDGLEVKMQALDPVERALIESLIATIHRERAA